MKGGKPELNMQIYSRNESIMTNMEATCTFKGWTKTPVMLIGEKHNWLPKNPNPIYTIHAHYTHTNAAEQWLATIIPFECFTCAYTH